MSDPPTRQQQFSALYATLHPELLRFVQRRAPEPGLAEDVVAETFLVLWRRFEEIPKPPGEARAWAYGVARNMMLSQRRGQWRHQALGVRLAGEDALARDDSHHGIDAVDHRLDVARAWARLSEAQQETLAMVVLDDLDAPRAAAVLGISPVAFRLRLSRARRALRLHLDHQPRAADPPARAAVRSLS